MSSDLEPLRPREAVEMYISHRRPDLSEKSLQNHKYRLDTFVEFCVNNDIDNLNHLTGRDLHRYRQWRDRQDIAPMTLRTHMATLRVFLEFVATIDGCEEGLREKVVLPEVKKEDQAKDVKLEESRADEILDYMDRFHYASREHVIIAVLWHTGIRLGTLRTLDVNDFDPDGQLLRIRHRPDTETPLKNGTAAERTIAIGEYYIEVIQDYLQHNRHDVTDEHGREPLVTSNLGRLSESATRSAVYRYTRPCVVAECPHDRDPETCNAMDSKRASECPTSKSPHAIRRGALTRMLREGIPEQVVSDRSNVSPDVLDQHYDRRSERERMEIRREFLEEKL